MTQGGTWSLSFGRGLVTESPNIRSERGTFSLIPDCPGRGRGLRWSYKDSNEIGEHGERTREGGGPEQTWQLRPGPGLCPMRLSHPLLLRRVLHDQSVNPSSVFPEFRESFFKNSQIESEVPGTPESTAG